MVGEGERLMKLAATNSLLHPQLAARGCLLLELAVGLCTAEADNKSRHGVEVYSIRRPNAQWQTLQRSFTRRWWEEV